MGVYMFAVAEIKGLWTRRILFPITRRARPKFWGVTWAEVLHNPVLSQRL